MTPHSGTPRDEEEGGLRAGSPVVPKFSRTLFPGRWREQALEQGALIASLVPPPRAEDNLSQQTLVKSCGLIFFYVSSQNSWGDYGGVVVVSALLSDFQGVL